MTWEQKLEALQSLCEISLKMRKPGDWYCSADYRSVGGDGLSVGAYGQGDSPRSAVENDWKQIVDFLPADKYIAIEHCSDRRHYRWNGYMWKELPK